MYNVVVLIEVELVEFLVKECAIELEQSNKFENIDSVLIDNNGSFFEFVSLIERDVHVLKEMFYKEKKNLSLEV